MGKLSALAVNRAIEPGRYNDGEGLYLQVTNNGGRSWVFRFMLARKSREMGLGPASSVTLAQARAKAVVYRELLAAGKDPIIQRDLELLKERRAIAKSKTFAECAEEYIVKQEPSWKHKKHAPQWRRSLEMYAHPFIGALRVDQVFKEQVIEILNAIWFTKPETASRVRNRMELILGYATALDYRQGMNPAQWKGNLDAILPKRSKVRKVKHFTALPRDQMGAFVAKLRREPGPAASALEFAILTATRTTETLEAAFEEFNTNEGVWIIPGKRMKGGIEHRVPLSDRALDIFTRRMERADSKYIFEGRKKGKPLSDMALLMAIRRAGFKATTHGFRSTFKDWASECTEHADEVSEMALAHTVGSKVAAAYRRGNLFDKRRLIMTEWAEFIEGEVKKALESQLELRPALTPSDTVRHRQTPPFNNS